MMAAAFKNMEAIAKDADQERLAMEEAAGSKA